MTYEGHPCADPLGGLPDGLQATFNRIPCGLAVYRAEGGRIIPLFHNPAFFELLGCSPAHADRIRREADWLGVHPEDLPALREKLDGLIGSGGVLRHTLRVFNDRAGEYRWVRLDASTHRETDGSVLLYGVYSDVSEQKRLEAELERANGKMEDIINAIPGGVAIYRVSDIFETVYFSDGVPELSGYTVEEYRELVKRDAAEMTYHEDTPMVVERAAHVIQTRRSDSFEFRKQHRDGHIVWVRAQVSYAGEDRGLPLLHCVFHNITDLKEAQLEMNHLVNSIPGGIASYKVEDGRFIPTFFSDGVAALTGHSREEYTEMVRQDAFNLIYEPDQPRVLAAARESRGGLDISYRMRHKDGRLVWIHLNGRRMGPMSDSSRFYAVFTGMSAETRLFQTIANETADGIYVIDRENYDLLYVNESKSVFGQDPGTAGQKCYAALHGMSAPCAFCMLNRYQSGSEEHLIQVPGTGRSLATRFRETDWNGIPAYILYIRDVTEEVNTRREKERLEQYFQTVLRHLPGGVAVVRYEADGSMTPEFLSEGFAAMTGMTPDEAWALYREDAMAGVHPDDQARTARRMADYIASGENRCELVYRLRKGADGYVWVKNTLTIIENEGGELRVYSVYHDMTREREEQERLQQQYRDLILQHYSTPDPNALIIGHCNISQNRILEISDHTDSNLLQTFGTVREEFFTGIASLVVDEEERQAFLDTYLNAPTLAAFRRGDTEQILRCFVKLPQEPRGRYVQFTVNLVETPDTGDITGILTATDVTEQTISDRILHQLSVTSYDFVVDLDLTQDAFTVLTRNRKINNIPPEHGRHSEWVAAMLQSTIVPKDREQYARAMDPAEMCRRLRMEGPYTVSFSITDEKGDIRTKNMNVSAVDLRLGRVCLVRTDITESVREQQGLLNTIAYTFDLLGLIDIRTHVLTLYTRQSVLENLPPHVIEHYDTSVGHFAEFYGSDEHADEAREQFHLDVMLRRLAEKPAGYDFVFPYQGEEGLRYKQINVLWGDENHRTICMVRADVTDMLFAERQSKQALEKALALAEEANRAKSDFLSAMSHDIRTPMNAIMGMTALAVAHQEDRARVADCLQKISISSKHLLSLINDILDMSKIERAQITLSRVRIALPDLLEGLSAIMEPQAKSAGLALEIRRVGITHWAFYGDSLRINQILINLLSNAVKFTPEGGRVDFQVEEIPAGQSGRARYCFTVRDTGIGIAPEFLASIFEPFTRSRGVTRVEGTGLGLSITKGLVDLMGGQISVESAPGRGSTFRVELECDTAPEGGEAGQTEAGAYLSGPEQERYLAGRCFLVAEDNALNAEILTALLEVYGASCVVRADGAQAVHAFRDAAPGTYAAVLMDVQMPVMNGYEATRAIRALERPDARAIPIIAMTANAFSEDVRAALEAGMNAHVAKPIDVDGLRATLCRVLAGAGVN